MASANERAGMNEATLHPAELLPAQRPWYRRRLWIWPVVLVALLLLYYLAGMAWLHQIDDDPAFAIETSAPEGGSRAVAMSADLIDREINTHRWVANDPFFMPGSMLDNMPNFQQGVIAALSRFAIELTDQIARTRGSSQVDPDLNTASGLLRYPGTVWIFDLSTSLAPTASSESQYRRGMRALRDYNERLAAGNAVFETRADNLLATLDRIAADIGSSSAALDRHLAESSGFGLDFQADDILYANKGRLYAYYLLLRELGQDYARVIQERDLTSAWAQMLDSFRQAATLQPWVVVNGPPDSLLLPSHLAAQGFFLLRARTQLREISNILLK
jgi:hypothetical protein